MSSHIGPDDEQTENRPYTFGQDAKSWAQKPPLELTRSARVAATQPGRPPMVAARPSAQQRPQARL